MIKGTRLDNIIFQVKLADVPIGISALYDSTKQFCRDYLTREKICFSVAVNRSDLIYEQDAAVREAVCEGTSVHIFSDAYLETLALYRKIANGLLAYDTLLFHGSAIAVDGQAYLFTAKSGTGKSTHTRLWREYFGDRAVMVNDDKPLLKITEQGVIVYGTPWDGKHRLSSNIAVPLKAVCILERGEVNRIGTVTAREAWPMLLQQSYRPPQPDLLARVMQLVDRLASQVGLYRLACNMDPAAVQTAYEGMQ